MSYDTPFGYNHPPMGSSNTPQFHDPFYNQSHSSNEFDYVPQQQPQYQQQQQPQYFSNSTNFISQMATDYVTGNSLASATMQIAPSLAASSKHYLDDKFGTLVENSSEFKQYWAVNTNEVMWKLVSLLIPFINTTHNTGGPRPLNTLDLYIPSMAYITYILLVGFVLGTQSRFGPEQLGITASSALVWLILEVCVALICIYVTGLYNVGVWHRVFVLSGYKFFYMVLCIGGYILLDTSGYYLFFIWSAIASFIVSFQMLQSVIAPNTRNTTHVTQFGNSESNQVQLYVSVGLSVLQPILIYWLTWHLVHSAVTNTSN